jgi:hypothetical protein
MIGERACRRDKGEWQDIDMNEVGQHLLVKRRW